MNGNKWSETILI